MAMLNNQVVIYVYIVSSGWVAPRAMCLFFSPWLSPFYLPLYGVSIIPLFPIVLLLFHTYPIYIYYIYIYIYFPYVFCITYTPSSPLSHHFLNTSTPLNHFTFPICLCLLLWIPLKNLTSSVGMMKFPTVSGKSFKIPWFETTNQPYVSTVSSFSPSRSVISAPPQNMAPWPVTTMAFTFATRKACAWGKYVRKQQNKGGI